MHTYGTRRSPGLAAAIVVLALFVAAPDALATDYTWEGDDAVSPSDWSLPANWATNIVPTAGDGAVFDPGVATGFLVDVAGIYTAAAKIDFNNISNAVGSQFELAPPGYLLLGDGATAAEIEHDSAAAIPQDGASMISADVSAVLVGATRDLAFDINSGTLTLSGRLGTAAQAVNLVAPGDGGSNVEAGGVLVLANADPAAPNNVTGTLTVAGELRVGPYGLASTTTPPAVVLTGSAAVLDLGAPTVGSAVTLGGGTVRATGSCTVTGAVTDAADMTFAAGGTLTFSHALGIALTGPRTWTVAEGTVVVTGDVTDDGGGPYDLAVLGPGTLRLDVGAIGVDTLTCGTYRGYGDPGLDGLTVIGDPTRRPAYVLINNKAAYSVAADHAYDEVDFAASDGCLAIGADTTSPIAMFGPSIRLGAAHVGDGNHTFSGTLTPYDDTYYLGGGGGTLTVAPDGLIDVNHDGAPGADPTHVQIGVAFGGSGPDDITHAGTVVLQGDDRFASVTGDIRLDGYAAIAAGPDALHGDALSAIDDAATVVLYPTGGLDLGDADITGLGPAAFGGSGLFDMQGGGISRNGGTVTEADVAELWGPQEPYGGYNGPAFEVVIGGGIVAGGPDTTVLDYGAVAADIFRKVGPNTVQLTAKPGDWGDGDPGETGDETYMFEMYVEDGRLIIPHDSALGEKANLPDPIYDGTALLTISGDAVAELQAGGNTADDAWVEFTLLDTATFILPAGQTYYAAGLQVGDTIPPEAAANGTLAGGGTLNLEHIEYPDGVTPTTVVAPVTGPTGSTLTLTAGASLVAHMPDLVDTLSPEGAFIIKEGGALTFATATTHNVNGTGAKAVGSMEPGAALAFGAGLTPGAFHADYITIRRVESGPNTGDPGLALVVDPDTGPAGWSAWDVDDPENALGHNRTYEIRVGADTEVDFFGSTFGTHSLVTPSYVDATGVAHTPVAHIEKTGGGYLMHQDPFVNLGDSEARKAYWIVREGTLGTNPSDSSDADGLGLDAWTWYQGGKPVAGVGGQHLEGIAILSGGTLWWSGTHGFLPASAYGYTGMPADGTEGDGFNPGEFRMVDGAALRGTSLVLGFAGTLPDEYLCYPTVVTRDAPTAITFGGDVDLRSGIKVLGSGAVTVNVASGGNVQFTGDLVGAQPVDVFEALNVSGSEVGISRSHTAVAGTDVASGGILAFSPVAPIQYTGDITLDKDSILNVMSGEVTLTGLVTGESGGGGGGGAVTQPHLNWDAAQDPAGDNLFESYWAGAPLNVTANRTWTFTNGAQTPVAVSDLNLVDVTHAYEFNAAIATALSFEEMEDFGSGALGTQDCSFEIVFRPADLVGDKILLETGGATDGTQIWLAGNTLNYHVRDSGSNMTATYTLPSNATFGLHQMVATFDMDEDGTTDRITLYFDGVQVDEATHTGVADWTGSNDAGLGTVNAASATGATGDFFGQLAIVRYYDAMVLTPAQVLDNFNALGPRVGTLFLVADGVTLNAEGGFTTVPRINLGGTLNVGADSDVGLIAAGSPAAVLGVTAGATLTADRLRDVPQVNLGGTLALAAGISTIGSIAGAGPACALDLAVGVTLSAGTLADVCEINLAAGSSLDVGAGGTGIGMIQGSSGTLNVAAGVSFGHTAAGGFHGLDAVNLGDGAQLTTGETNNLTQALTLGTGAVLDLTSGNLIVDYDTTNPYDAIEALIISGIGDTTLRPWDGPGINSSDADDSLFALGILDNANPPTVVAPFNDTTRLFEGEGVDSTSVLVKYTYYGDANLDGVVSPLDVQRLILSWNGQTEGDPRWAVGDFNYDGLISPFDVQLLILGWNGQGGALSGGSPACPLGFSARAGGGTPSPTPEPATLALVALGGLALLVRRRR